MDKDLHGTWREFALSGWGLQCWWILSNQEEYVGHDVKSSASWVATQGVSSNQW